MDCIILLNNETDYISKSQNFQAYPKNFADSVIGLTADTYRDLCLPLVPYFKERLFVCNYWNSDYGFYVAQDYYESKEETDVFFIKVDHDGFFMA